MASITSEDGDRPPRRTPAAELELETIRRQLAANRADGRLRPIGMDILHIGPDALDALQAVLAALQVRGPIVVLSDVTPMRRGSADLKPLVLERLQRHGVARHVVLGADRPELHADEAALREADAAIRGAECVISIGSGTVTDIAKDATYRAGNVPLVVIQTAASVNAFSDDMAVLLKHGVKRTVPSRWPSALLVDIPIIAGAPPAMNRAGFGELASMFTAPADWYLATALGMDDGWEPSVVALFRAQGEELLANAGRVHDNDPEALGLLARLMTLSGIALGVAGSSAPISGTEHIVSHLLDMDAEQSGSAVNLHGAQVGVAATISAVAWKETLDHFDPDRIDLEAAYPSADRVRAQVHAAFRSLDPTMAVAEECWQDVARKLERWTAARPRFEMFLAEWPRHRTALASLVAEPSSLAAAIRRAGAPVRFSELPRGIGRDDARWALLTAPLMRERFVLADLCAFTGSWTGVEIDRLLHSAAKIGGGV
jgi:glycerol-1-phosphate dehydrogenase [NAD(P)+]